MSQAVRTGLWARAVGIRRGRAGVEELEPRRLLSTYLVTNTADSGPGSLRDAITQANANAGPDEIDFGIGSGGGIQTISLASPLPVISDPLVINGTTQPGYAGSPLIELSGWGLSINAGGSTLSALCIHTSNKGPLITLAGAGGDTVQGCYLGTDPTGMTAVGNGDYGIYVTDTPNNQIGGTQPGQGNVIAGNNSSPDSAGILIFGQDANHNQIQGNLIGTNVAGTAALPNTYGIIINFSALNTLIGGLTAGARNLLSGNAIDDVLLANQSHNTTFQGNIIGPDITGTLSLSNNNLCGIESEDGAVNTIGGTVPAARNIVSGHQYGVFLNGVHGKFNVVQGNYIGTDITGTVAMPNTVEGVGILTSTLATIGGTSAAARNIIAGNQVGMVISAGNNVVQGNYVGLNAAGAPLGNPGNGILVNGSGVTIGGAAAGAGNVISANGNGLVITAGNTTVRGNFIGTNPTGTAAIPNVSDGILINNGATNTIGGTASGSRNVVSGNGRWGVELTGTATGNVLQGNYLGTTASGSAPLGNTLGGVLVAAPSTTVGGTAAGSRNVVSGNPIGISVTANNVTVQGNYVGTDAGGANPLPNAGAGITVSGNTDRIGGTTAARNVISGNGADGIDVTAGSGTLIQGNYIGTNAAGSGPLANGRLGASVAALSVTMSGNLVSANPAGGIVLASSGALVTGNLIGTNAGGAAATGMGNGGDGIAITGANNAIGGATPATRNVVAGNVNGISVIGASASGNVIQGNYIGTDGSAAAAVPNSANGILVTGPASITIGGVAAGAGNVISGNAGDGISFAASTAPPPTQYLVQGNFIGTNAAGTAALPNQQNGIEIRTANALIGGTVSGAGNVISGNGVVGVICGGAGALLQGNFIGTDATGNLPIPNVNGIVVGANNVTIGGTAAGAGNIISGNANGIVIGANTALLTIQGNYVGTNAAGTAAVPNSNGIKATGGGPVTIGGTVAGAGNLISGNSGTGIALLLSSGQSGTFTIQGNEIGTDVTGAVPLGNGRAGILLQGSQGTLVGGETAGAGNIIAFNADGVDVTGNALGNTISGNLIFSNNGIGIDLGADGPTPNDPGDLDTGPNNLQNYPVPASAVSTPFATTVTGTMGSAPSSTYTLEFFAVQSTGAVFLGHISVTTDASGLAPFSAVLPTGGVGGQLIVATATDAGGNTSELSPGVTAVSPAVVRRAVFYNNSVFDGRNPAANLADDGAIATDKQALLPGGTAAFSNYTSYTDGINGVMVDVSNLPGTPTPADFSFKIGNNNDPTTWQAPASAPSVSSRPVAGVDHTTRIEITWPDHTIQNTWLQVTVASDAVTGLAAPDVFYFGNQVGESGNSASDATVDSADELAARNDPHSFLNPAAITNPHDYNRDGRVDILDQLIARANATGAGAAIQLITPPVPSSASRSVPVVSHSQPGHSTIGDRLRRKPTSLSMHSRRSVP